MSDTKSYLNQPYLGHIPHEFPFYGNALIDQCLRLSASTIDSEQAVQLILSSMCAHLGCDRAYIFEKISDISLSNTYESCAPGIVSQKEALQEEPSEIVDWWWALFERDQAVIISELESIKDTYPQAYACLRPQNISALVAVPIHVDDQIIGFLGVDNPVLREISELPRTLFIISQLISSILKRRDLMSDLEFMSYHDQLTGAMNRYAFVKACEHAGAYRSLGIAYCDISGLKQINDTLGHKEGDALILQGYHMLKTIFDERDIFRTGGDEFIILSFNTPQTSFQKKISKLKNLRKTLRHHLSIGSAWGKSKTHSLSDLMTAAENTMYEDKYAYYQERNPLSRYSRGNRAFFRYNEASEAQMNENSVFYQFIQNNYFNEQTLFRSITASEASYYLYFGDLQTNLFYISDNMRDTFDFKSNLVFDLIGIWEKQISNEEDLALYRSDIQDIMNQKKDVHDLRYRVKDREGNDIWIRCYGLLEWNADKTVPLFFSGCISRQERDFLVDPVTNFPREHAAVKKIAALQKGGSRIVIIGFTLNHFSEINEVKGRYTANIVLQGISQNLEAHFEGQLIFYRLDGLRFIALLTSPDTDDIEGMISDIKAIVDEAYKANHLVMRTPCSVGLFLDEDSGASPQDIVVSMISLLSMAKRNPEQPYVVHSQEHTQLQKEQVYLSLALSENVVGGFENFRIVIQPTVSSVSQEIVSGECLLRWRFAGKEISPLFFISLLEKNRLIAPIGRWVFEQVVKTCKRVIIYRPDFRLAFNVSYYQILDEEFVPYMRRMLQKYKLDGKHLILELTETHFDDAPEKLEHFIESCKALGMDVALDDFGHGYSSLAMLLKYPANIVKLDRSLLNEMFNSKDNISFISSIVYACHRFGKSVCAEGVETEEDLSIIENTGCDMIQGFYFYHPMEIKDFFKLFTKKP